MSGRPTKAAQRAERVERARLVEKTARKVGLWTGYPNADGYFKVSLYLEPEQAMLCARVVPDDLRTRHGHAHLHDVAGRLLDNAIAGVERE